MFIPDTLRSCMVEPDVSSYLQTPSSGQLTKRIPKGMVMVAPPFPQFQIRHWVKSFNKSNG
ncbi:hypothetical protein NQ315_010183 [Exocentrus adspersus]|uniref:Uncharacterized protein n=1 Tax=Exocentrus adspersus TaxID=1586481 RepID=A0AAV8WAL7_9CUCU|nr:hypothetical protein NQ315_010183 [Exocentrus adspersus]